MDPGKSPVGSQPRDGDNGDTSNESTPLLRDDPSSSPPGQATPPGPIPIGRQPARGDKTKPGEFDILLSKSVPSGGPMLEPEPVEYSMLRRPRRYSDDSNRINRGSYGSHQDSCRTTGSGNTIADEEAWPNPNTPLIKQGNDGRSRVPPSGIDSDFNDPLSASPRKTPYLNNVSVSRFWMIFSGILATNFIACFDGTIMASSHPVITSYFKSSNSASWLSTAFLLTSTSFQPLLGRLSDSLGRKPPYLITMAIFLLATMWCGLAQSMTSFILARAACGLGAGGMMSLGSIIISDLVPIE